MHFLREEFISVAASPVLFELHESLLIETLRSDFVQVCFPRDERKVSAMRIALKWLGVCGVGPRQAVVCMPQ